MLYYRAKETGGQSEDSGHIRFFSFSLIEGYISLVMDEQTTQRLDHTALPLTPSIKVNMKTHLHSQYTPLVLWMIHQ